MNGFRPIFVSGVANIDFYKQENFKVIKPQV